MKKKSIFLFVEVKNIDGHLVEDPGQTPTQASMLPPGHWSCLKIRKCFIFSVIVILTLD